MSLASLLETIHSRVKNPIFVSQTEEKTFLIYAILIESQSFSYIWIHVCLTNVLTQIFQAQKRKTGMKTPEISVLAHISPDH